MQRTALTLAVAAALSTFAGAASAYSFSDGGYTAANTAEIKISGSSATNNQTKTWAQTVLCQAGSTNQITYTKDSNNFAIVCKPKANLGFTKANIAVIKNSSGGSGNGISQLKVAGQGYMNVFQTNPATGPLGANSLADLGVSDEEPSILVKAGAVVGVDDSGILSDALNVVTFGTPVTLGLRNALQSSQIASGKLPSSCTVGNESEACMPSLSQSQIASIFSGNLLSWSELGMNNPADNNVHIARRVITSGTQTASRLFFLNDPCAENMVQFVPGNNGESGTKADACNAAAPAGTVFEGSGGGNVAACLTNHQRNGRWAIGINSLEVPNTTETTPAYNIGGGAATGGTLLNKDYQRHIKIDGFAPTTFNTATGRYKFWYEATVNNDGSPSADAAALKNAMLAGFNDPAVLVPLNATFNTTVLLGAGKSAGILAPTSSGVAPAAPATESATVNGPQMYYTRSISGAPNSCQPAMSFYATEINP